MKAEPNMPAIQPANSPGGSATTDERRRGLEKLQRLKAQVFAPETKPERVARALTALQKAKKPAHLDAASLKYIAQHADLEGI